MKHVHFEENVYEPEHRRKCCCEGCRGCRIIVSECNNFATLKCQKPECEDVSALLYRCLIHRRREPG